MKYKILVAALLVLVLAGLYVATQDGNGAPSSVDSGSPVLHP